MAELRSKPIALKVTPQVHEFLSSEAERRGISIGMLCAVIVADWKVKLEDHRSMQNRQAEVALQSLLGEVGPELRALIEGQKT